MCVREQGGEARGRGGDLSQLRCWAVLAAMQGESPRTAPRKFTLKDVKQRLLPELSPRGTAVQPAPALWDTAIHGVSKKRQSLKEAKEAKAASLMRGYLGAMSAHSNFAAVQEEALIALCHIIAKGVGVRTLVRTGGLEHVVMAMKMHIPSVDIQQRGATALGQVASVDANCRAAIVAVDGVEALVAAARAHPHNGHVVERCSYALGAIAAGNNECKAELVRCSAVTCTTRA